MPLLSARDLTAVILAGGRGVRIGVDKALLPFGDGTLLTRALRRMGCLSGDLVVVARQGQRLPAPGARLVHDLQADGGVLAALGAGLLAARHEWCAVVACDLPFINLDLWRHLLTLRSGADVVVPRTSVGLEPLHALYHRRCLPPLREALERGERRVVSFYGSVRVHCLEPSELARLDPSGRALFNINTPKDLALARRLDAESGPHPESH